MKDLSKIYDFISNDINFDNGAFLNDCESEISNRIFVLKKEGFFDDTLTVDVVKTYLRIAFLLDRFADAPELEQPK